MSKSVNKTNTEPATGCKVVPIKKLKKDEAREVVAKIFSIFDKSGDCRITGKEVQAVDEQDDDFPLHGRDAFLKDTLTPRDFKLAAKSENLKDTDMDKKMSQEDFCKLLGGKFDPDINIGRTDAYVHLLKNKDHLKALKAYLEGI